MNVFRKTSAALPLAALVASLTVTTAPVQAQGLFDKLFGGGLRRSERTEFPPPPPAAQPRQAAPKKAAAAKPVKISAPSYYTYKAEALAKVDFSPLAAKSQSASLEPVMSSAFREALSGLEGFDMLAEPEIGKAVVAYYSDHPEFVWVTDGALNAKAAQAAQVLGDAGSYGLDAADYKVQLPDAGLTVEPGKLNGLIRYEMELSARVLRYTRDAHAGVINPNKLSGYHDFPAKPLDLAGVLSALSSGEDTAALLEAQHPQSPEYKALRTELAALHASEENEIVVDAKLLLKPGETSPELPKLLQLINRDLDDQMRSEFGDLLSRLSTTETYTDELIPLMKAVQKREGLKQDGVIGPRTVAMLAGTSKADRIGKVVVALEQLRWHPSELGDTRVFINQPAFTAAYIEGGQEKLKTRTVIGAKGTQTTFFFDKIKQVDYNPYWGVPQSIIVNEMLPRLRNDPGYLDRAGYEVVDAKGKRVPSSAINWSQYGGKVPFGVRQAPSEANALGELKILFPNKHAIYMHDTPQKALFDRDMRAFSHGCVRLADPRGMAAAVLGTSVDYIADKLKKGHSTEKVNRDIPVYVAYFTAWPLADGRMEYFTDVYDRDSRVLEAMKRTVEVRAPSS
ncbi:L,D-transpeptidase family protein [Oryzicola mucosus]|uniref:L,D-transpeptidase family protein n=1 Tax=Oryzicola mucosus TaxID=2767425 RepID=A0A8J6PMP0_9HYPH|nr:L,D-transpeptidase family protein [Oryzicola mucosus]MBD0416166.1 L,D-transpeptidase family protein [Oryzicola mucosus]